MLQAFEPSRRQSKRMSAHCFGRSLGLRSCNETDQGRREQSFQRGWRPWPMLGLGFFDVDIEHLA